MAELMNIGFGNLVNMEKVIAIISPDSAPAKRLAQRAKQAECAVDATQGRKTRSILVMDQGSVVLSALGPDTLGGRFHERLSAKAGSFSEKKD